MASTLTGDLLVMGMSKADAMVRGLTTNTDAGALQRTRNRVNTLACSSHGTKLRDLLGCPLAAVRHDVTKFACALVSRRPASWCRSESIACCAAHAFFGHQARYFFVKRCLVHGPSSISLPRLVADAALRQLRASRHCVECTASARWPRCRALCLMRYRAAFSRSAPRVRRGDRLPAGVPCHFANASPTVLDCGNIFSACACSASA